MEARAARNRLAPPYGENDPAGLSVDALRLARAVEELLRAAGAMGSSDSNTNGGSEADADDAEGRTQRRKWALSRDFKVRWSSPLVGKASCKARTLHAERILALACAAGCCVQEAARVLCGGAGVEGATAVEAARAASAALRRAAGIWEAVSRAGHEAVASDANLCGERSAEAYAGVAEAMSAVALADAQAAVALAAEHRATPSRALAAKLHRGAAQLYDGASDALRAASRGLEAAPSALLYYLRLAPSLTMARARRCLAVDVRAADRTGEAVSLLRRAKASLDATAAEPPPLGVAAAGGGAWAEALAAERAAVAAELGRAESENGLMMQPTPNKPLAIEAKVIVTAIPYGDDQERVALADDE